MAGCPACTSPHRAEIEARLTAKESYRSIARWLAEERGERIAHTTLFKHGQEHMNQAAAFADKLLSIPKLKLALAPPIPNDVGLPSDGALPPLEALAHIQNKALQVVDALTEEDFPGFTPQMVSLFTASLKEARQAAKHRHELVFGKKYVVQHEQPRHAALKGLSNEELRQRKEELLRKRKERERVE